MTIHKSRDALPCRCLLAPTLLIDPQGFQPVGNLLERRSNVVIDIPALRNELRQLLRPLLAQRRAHPTVDDLVIELLPIHPIIGLLVRHDLPKYGTERIHIRLVVVGTTIRHLGCHIPQTSSLTAHFVHIIRLRAPIAHHSGQSKVNQLHSAIEGEANVIRLEVPVQHHRTGDGRPVAVRHGVGQALGAAQDLQVRELLLLPEPPPPVADARVVAQVLRQRPPVEPFQDDEARSLGRGAGPDQADDVGVVELGVDLQFPLDLVDGQGQVLALRLERLDDDGPAAHDGRVDPVVAPVGEVLDVLEGVPLEIEAGPGHAEALLRRSAGRTAGQELLLLLQASESLLLLLRGQVRWMVGMAMGGTTAGVVMRMVQRQGRRGRIRPPAAAADADGGRRRMRMGRPDVPVGRHVDHDLLGEGVDAGDGGRQAHVDEELDRLRPHDGPPDGEVDEGDVGRARLVADGDGDGRPDVGDGAAEGLGPPLRVGRDPHDVLGLLGALAQGGTEAMGPAARHLAVVDVDQFGPDRILEGRRAEVAVGQLVRLGPRPEPHLGDVESHDVARGRQDGLDRVGRLVEEALLVLGLEQRGRRRGRGGSTSTRRGVVGTGDRGHRRQRGRRRPRPLREGHRRPLLHLRRGRATVAAVQKVQVAHSVVAAGRGRRRRQGRAANAAPSWGGGGGGGGGGCFLVLIQDSRSRARNRSLLLAGFAATDAKLRQLLEGRRLLDPAAVAAAAAAALLLR
mmetsp:Transcript_31358/g.91856  ORF Transcript_31358/g.91856 Transcript_31358/m.91856 type:complete len:737 (-) Transcript_31358:627-2837(-)